MASSNRVAQPSKQERSVNEHLKSPKIVKIYVGPKRELWHVSEDLICDRIPFFKGAFKSRFKEGESKAMDLPTDDPEAFGLLVDWLYSSSYRLDCKFCAPINAASGPPAPAHDLPWFKLWVLADKLNLTDLTRQALDRHDSCMVAMKQGLSREAVIYACDQRVGDSALRKHLVFHVLRELLVPSGRSKNIVGSNGEAAAANSSFNREVFEAILHHTQTPAPCSLGSSWFPCDLQKPSDQRQDNNNNNTGWDAPIGNW